MVFDDESLPVIRPRIAEVSPEIWTRISNAMVTRVISRLTTQFRASIARFVSEKVIGQPPTILLEYLTVVGIISEGDSKFCCVSVFKAFGFKPLRRAVKKMDKGELEWVTR